MMSTVKPRSPKLLLTGLIFFGLPCAAFAQDRIVPQTESKQFTGPEVAELEAHLDALESAVERLQQELDEASAAGLDTSEIETRLAQARKAEEEFQKISPGDPIYPFLPALHEKLDELDQLVPNPSGPAAPSLEQARQLDAFLYHDLGPAPINYRWQTYVLSEAQEWVTHPGISSDVCKFLRDSLMEYERLGGGKASPFLMEQLAESLYRASEPDDIEARQAILRLHHDALAWFERLQRNDSYEQYNAIFNRLFDTSEELEAVALDESENPKEGVEKDTKDDTAGSATHGNAREAKRRIQFHLRRFNWDSSKIEEITRLGLADYGSPKVNKDMTRILLIAYRHILMKPRTAVSDKVVHIIDARLIRLAENPGKLTTKEHWRLWAKAVAALRTRASTNIKEFIQRQKKIEKVRDRKKAFEYAWRGMHHKHRQGRIPDARTINPQSPTNPHRKP